MKKNVFKFFSALLLGVGCCELQAQTMYVRPFSGSQASYPITTVRKLTFSGDNMLVTSTSGSIFTHSKTGNRYINFNDLTLSITPPQIRLKVFNIYPNPVSDVLHIKATDEVQPIDNIEIFALEGRLVMRQKQVNIAAPQVAVSTLPQGIYLCKITSENTTQTIKFIKQ